VLDIIDGNVSVRLKMNRPT